LSDGVELVVVGSVAFDSVKSPAGEVTEALGGSAVYFSLAAAFFCRVGIVAVVGDDFPREHIDLLHQRGVDTAGLEVASGRTFRWKGFYSDDFSSRETVETCLNVFADFEPRIPPSYKRAKAVFLGNISPELQAHVLSELGDTGLSVADTMNFWIDSSRSAVLDVISSCDGIMLNDEEARALSERANLIEAGRFLSEGGKRFAVVKKGEHGCLLVRGEDLFFLPGFPVTDVRDPTGAGDSFAGGFMGYLAQCGDRGWESLKSAAAAGTATASFTVERFSVEGLLGAGVEDVSRRASRLAGMCAFNPPRF